MTQLAERGPAGLALGAAMAVGCVAALAASYRLGRATRESLEALGKDRNLRADLVREARAVLRGAKGPGQLVR
jgi:hypothetical protein